MSDDQIAATIMAKLDGPAVPADEPAEPAAVQWPTLGQGERGVAIRKPPDPVTDEVLKQLGMSPSYQLGRGDR